jgi:hypothetical protein
MDEYAFGESGCEMRREDGVPMEGKGVCARSRQNAGLIDIILDVDGTDAP